MLHIVLHYQENVSQNILEIMTSTRYIIICYMPQHGNTPFSTSDCNSGSADSAARCSCLLEASPASWLNVFVSTDGAHPPIRCGSLHEARGAGGTLAQGLRGELADPKISFLSFVTWCFTRTRSQTGDESCTSPPKNKKKKQLAVGAVNCECVIAHVTSRLQPD